MDEVMEEHRILRCRNLAIGGLPVSYREKGAAGYAEFAKEASEVAKKLAAHGFTWSYHNHSFELEKFDGKTALSILYEESDPEYFLGKSTPIGSSTGRGSRAVDSRPERSHQASAPERHGDYQPSTGHGGSR